MKYSMNIIAILCCTFFVSNLNAQLRTAIFSFYDQARSATWKSTTHGTSEVHTLEFGVDHKQYGSARIVENRTMEDGRSYSVLHTHPKWTSHGVIRGYFPFVTLPAKPLISGSIGFIKPSGSPKSDGARFLIYAKYYEVASRSYKNVKVFDYYKRYDGKMKDFEVDLSRFAGKRVSIELRVDTGNKPTEDWAAWHGLALWRTF